MNGGLFVALYDEDSLKLYLNRGTLWFPDAARIGKQAFVEKPSL